MRDYTHILCFCLLTIVQLDLIYSAVSAISVACGSANLKVRLATYISDPSKAELDVELATPFWQCTRHMHIADILGQILASTLAKGTWSVLAILFTSIEPSRVSHPALPPWLIA